MPKKKFNHKAKAAPIQKTRVPNPLMEQVLQNLKAIQEADPHWEKSIAEWAKAEAAIDPKDDPAEGQIVTAKIIPPKRNP